MALCDYLDKWLEEVAKLRLRESTFTSYEAILRNYVKAFLGAKRLSDLQAYEVQELYNDLKNRGLSSRTIRYTHVVLSSAMKQAVKWRIITQNPCELCDLPRLERNEISFPRRDFKIFRQCKRR